MKTIATVLLLAIIFQGVAIAVDLINITPVEPYLINKILNYGPTRLHNSVYEGNLVPRFNLEEELEQKLLETRLIQRSG